MLPSRGFGQAVTAVDLSPIIKGKLLACGYRSTDDLIEIGATQLARELDIPPRDALQTLKLVRQHHYHQLPVSIVSSASSSHAPFSSSSSSSSSSQSSPPVGTTARDLLHEQSQPYSRITTCHEKLDQLLGGGVTIGQLTEFCGVPGIGKTQVSMQLAVDATIPNAFGGVEGRCVYIDTEGSFSIERVVGMAGALIEHLRQVEAPAEEAAKLTLDYVLQRIIYYRVHDYIEQLAVINTLPDLVGQHPDIKLVVLDSVTFHFRHGFDDYGVRTRLLNGSAKTLSAIAKGYKIAVVLVNQVATKLSLSAGTTSIVPALGDTWGTMCAIRVILFWKDRERNAFLFKSSGNKSTTCVYQVTPDGIR